MNKLIARIFAVVMVVVMLGTVSFAANIADADYDNDNGTLTPGTAPTERTTKTLLAFATDTENDVEFNEGSDVIIALVQDTTIDTTIPVDTERVGSKKFISIIIGGDGTTDVACIPTTEEIETINASTEPITIGDKKYLNVVSVTYTIDDADGRTLTKYGMSFNSYDKTTGAVLNAEENIDVVTTLTEGITISGSFTFTAVVLAVDVENLTGNVKATPIIEYAD